MLPHTRSVVHQPNHNLTGCVTASSRALTGPTLASTPSDSSMLTQPPCSMYNYQIKFSLSSHPTKQRTPSSPPHCPASGTAPINYISAINNGVHPNAPTTLACHGSGRTRSTHISNIHQAVPTTMFNHSSVFANTPSHTGPAKIKSQPMISPKPKQKHSTKKNQQRITLGSFNLNGLGGKAPTLSAFIMSTALSTSNTFIIGIQEHKLLPNHSLTSLPCLALPTFSNHAGTKGLMWLISKNLTHAYDIPQLQCNDLIQWIQIHTSSSSILCGNTYWPCTNYDSKAAFNTVSLIISTLNSFIKQYPKVPIYLMGDFNADPFINKGANRANLHRLLAATPSLRIISRPSPNDHTRPRSGRNIDLIITNPP